MKDLVLYEPDLSPREPAVCFTVRADAQAYYALAFKLHDALRANQAKVIERGHTQ